MSTVKIESSKLINYLFIYSSNMCQSRPNENLAGGQSCPGPILWYIAVFGGYPVWSVITSLKNNESQFQFGLFTETRTARIEITTI
jgi:hypothetical protein